MSSTGDFASGAGDLAASDTEDFASCTGDFAFVVGGFTSGAGDLVAVTAGDFASRAGALESGVGGFAGCGGAAFVSRDLAASVATGGGGERSLVGDFGGDDVLGLCNSQTQSGSARGTGE